MTKEPDLIGHTSNHMTPRFSDQNVFHLGRKPYCIGCRCEVLYRSNVLLLDDHADLDLDRQMRNIMNFYKSRPRTT